MEGLPYLILRGNSQKGGSAVAKKIDNTLSLLGKLAAILAVLVEAGKEVKALCEQ